jgi:RNA polymerase sigma factor (sigma-70 family)
MSSINASYLDYSLEATVDTLNALLAAVTRYATNLARRMDVEAAEDVAQDIAVKVWLTLPHFRARSSFQTYVHCMTSRHVIDLIRAAKKKSKLDGLDDSQFLEQPNWDDIAYDIAKLSGLSNADIHLLHIFILNPDFERTAKVLGTTPDAVRSRLKRIRKKQRLGDQKQGGNFV